MKEQDLKDEINKADELIRKYVGFYHAREEDCPADFKFLMLMNNWTSPFIALNELLKVIDTDKMLLKRIGIKIKTNYTELQQLLQNAKRIYQ